MPIDKNGVIYPKEDQKKNKISIKDICLIITTCVSIIAPITMIYQNKMQKLQYEMDIQELQMEKSEYENMLREKSIYLRSSFIVCHVDYIETLFCDLGEENSVKILYNDITKVFFDDRKKKYLDGRDIDKNENLQEYEYVCPEVVFLKIEAVSNRIIRDVNINFIEIEADSNIKDKFKTFENIKNKECYKEGKNANFKVGDVYPNEIILIPVVLEFSEGGDSIDYEQTDVENRYIIFDYNESIYKKIYVPQNITCYDDFFEENKEFNIRDMNDSLITKFYYEEQG